jgi:hypothetical protein
MLLVLMSVNSYATMPTAREYSAMFSIPREPMTLLGSGQDYFLTVPAGKKVVITDVFIENMGTGTSLVEIDEQAGPVSYEARYSFSTQENEHLFLNFNTGLRLGDLNPIQGSVRIHNNGPASVLLRINGVIM